MFQRHSTNSENQSLQETSAEALASYTVTELSSLPPHPDQTCMVETNTDTYNATSDSSSDILSRSVQLAFAREGEDQVYDQQPYQLQTSQKLDQDWQSNSDYHVQANFHGHHLQQQQHHHQHHHYLSEQDSSLSPNGNHYTTLMDNNTHYDMGMNSSQCKYCMYT